MLSVSQKQALFLWHSLPHLMIWGVSLLAIMSGALNSSFSPAIMAAPLLIALLWSWQWRSVGISVSLILLGVFTDMLFGWPLGWHSILWLGCYIAFPLIGREFLSDTPFISRWMISMQMVALYLLADLLLRLIFDLAAFGGWVATLHLLLVASVAPSINWLMYHLRRNVYRKLWTRLPEEIRMGVH